MIFVAGTVTTTIDGTVVGTLLLERTTIDGWSGTVIYFEVGKFVGNHVAGT
jgi:hypothetical protein